MTKILKIIFIYNSLYIYIFSSDIAGANFTADREFAIALRRIEMRCNKRKTHVTVSKWEYASMCSLSGNYRRVGNTAYRFAETICNDLSVAMQRDGANGRRAVIVPQLLSYLIATSG